MKQLSATGGNIAAMCPICLVNLNHAAQDEDVAIKDISEYLVEAYCGKYQSAASAES
jgi:Fe-S oxidoreductase